MAITTNSPHTCHFSSPICYPKKHHRLTNYPPLRKRNRIITTHAHPTPAYSAYLGEGIVSGNHGHESKPALLICSKPRPSQRKEKILRAWQANPPPSNPCQRRWVLCWCVLGYHRGTGGVGFVGEDGCKGYLGRECDIWMGRVLGARMGRINESGVEWMS